VIKRISTVVSRAITSVAARLRSPKKETANAESGSDPQRELTDTKETGRRNDFTRAEQLPSGPPSFAAKGYDTVSNWFRSLSEREKGLVLGGVLVLLMIGANQLAAPIQGAFSAQEQRLAELERFANATPAVVERFSRLKSRREQLEARFREIEFKEGALSYIENLVRQQPGVAPGFDIREGTPRSFGKAFEQLPFGVRFQTTSASGFVDFLKSVARGERSLLITKLEIQKPRRGDRLEVDLELNTIRQAS
jgi:hypothetical protein